MTAYPMAEIIARDIHSRLPDCANVGVDDLKNIAVLAAIEVAHRFHPARGTFANYVRRRMRGAVVDFLRGLDHISRDHRRLVKKIEELSVKLGPGIPPSAIRLAAGVDPSKDYLLGEMTMVPLSGTVRNTESIDVLSIIRDDADLPETKSIGREVREILALTLDQLKPRTRRVMELYYFGDRTMKQIGEEIGVNESRVSQLHANGLAKCRDILAVRGLQSYQQIAA
jgi:RNA polymerase sigma factor for flagellar operon FliA